MKFYTFVKIVYGIVIGTCITNALWSLKQENRVGLFFLLIVATALYIILVGQDEEQR